MYRKGSIYATYLRDENGAIKRHFDGKAQQEWDISGMPNYEYKFSLAADLDCKFDKNFKALKEQGISQDIQDEIFEIAVKDFAYELAYRMKYKNYKKLESQGISPSMIIWDEDLK
jgi:hypothetical protein